MSGLSPALEAFLREPHLGVLATLRRDGWPHLTVVWYLYEEGEVKVTITDTRAKYKHVMRDPRVALAVVGTSLPYKEVVFEGNASVSPDENYELFRRLAIRYYGEIEGEAYTRYTRDIAKDNRLILHFAPQRIAGWDFGVEDDHHMPWLPGYDPTLKEAG